MDTTLPTPRLTTPAQAVLAILSRERHLEHAIPHNLAAELGSTQIAAAFQIGSWPPPGWREQTLRDATDRFLRLRNDILWSGLAASGLLLLALAVAALFGKLYPSLPLDYGKLVTAIGATVAAWGTFLQLSAPNRTYRGNLLHEVTHTSVVVLLVAAGIAMAGIGSLWWQ
jgi:hypothetical protein